MAAEPSYKIFIRGIAPTVDENGLELAFSKYGRIMEGIDKYFVWLKTDSAYSLFVFRPYPTTCCRDLNWLVNIKSVQFCKHLDAQKLI